MELYDGKGNKINLGSEVKTHTVVKTYEVEGGTTTAVDVEGYLEGTLKIRGGGSYMPYKVYDSNGVALLTSTGWGAEVAELDVTGASKVELSPTSLATVVWKVKRETEGEALDDYRDNRILVWHDEFNDQTLDNNKWYEEKSYKRRGSGRGDGTNAFVEQNELHLRIMRENQYLENHTEREWSGTVLHSHFHYKYGLAEAKIKFADCGAWMSFWTVGTNMDEYPEEPFTEGVPWTRCGEMDFVECNGGLGISGNIHYDANLGNEDDSINVYTSNNFDGMSDYHIFSCEWTEEKIIMYVDYHKVGSVNIDSLKTDETYNAFKLAHRILFSCQPVLPASYNNRLPQDGVNKLEGVVDWVRVYAPIGWENIEPTELLIDGNDGSEIVELNVGDVHDCLVTINPEQVVNQSTTWRSSLSDVVAISRTGGRLTALQEGYSTITATMWNGIQTSIVVHVAEKS